MIDCHYHFDESIVSLSGLIASMDAAGIEKTAIMPTLCPPLELPGFASNLMPFWRRGLHRQGGFLQRQVAKIYQNQVKSDGTVDLLGRRYTLNIQPDNDPILKALEREPDRFLGFVFVNPKGPVEPISEIERCMGNPRMIGIKAHSFWHDYPVSKLIDTAALCEKEGWPILLHLGLKQRGDFRILPERFKNLKIIYAHAGVPYLPLVCRYAKERENVFVDLSSSAYLDIRNIELVLHLAGPDKCIFGTDGPYFHAENDRFDYEFFKARLEGLNLKDDDMERITRRNFLEIIGAT